MGLASLTFIWQIRMRISRPSNGIMFVQLLFNTTYSDDVKINSDDACINCNSDDDVKL